MKRWFGFFFVMIIVLFPLMGRDWLVMVYLGGDNSLSGAIVGDVDEIEEAMGSVSGDIDIVIQCDGNNSGSYSGYADATGSDIATVRRYELAFDGNDISNAIDESPIADLGELNSADPDVIADFVDWAVTNYPADHYMLILWDHGAGWVKSEELTKGGLWDDTSDDYLSSAGGEWRDMLEQVTNIIGDKLDILGNDMCVMSYMEMLWDVAPYVDMYVSSEANEPWDGWYYNNWIKDLNGTLTLDQIGQMIVDDYADYYSNSAATMTYQIISDDVYALKSYIFLLAKELIDNNGGRDASAVQSCIDDALPMSSGTFYEDFKDLWSFCDELENNSSITDSAQTLAGEIKDLIDILNPYDWNYGFNGSHGLGIYLPDDDNIYQFDYPYNASTHAWNVDCYPWTDFIYGEITTSISLQEYPNKPIEPNEGKNVFVTMNKIKTAYNPVSLEIYDMSGRKRGEISVDIAEEKDMSYLPAGNYFMIDKETKDIYRLSIVK